MNNPVFLDQDLAIFRRGSYQPIDRDFISEASQAILPLVTVQKKYGKLDNDSFFNELKDGMIGAYLGFDLVNTQKHGLDAKNSQTGCYLEVKQASFNTSSWGATFNDTTYEKAQAFKDRKMFLAVGVWAGISELLFIVHGQNPNIGDYLQSRVDFFKEGGSVRSTQSISVKRLVAEYGFLIYSPTKSRKELESIFRLKYKGADWWSKAIYE